MSEDSFFREVNEELHSERMRNFWRNYGAYVIGAAVAVVLLVAVAEGWNWWQSTHSARSSELLYKALDYAQKGELDKAQQALKTTESDGANGYPLLARFREAELLLQQGKNDQAAAAYDALAADTNERRLRELASVLAAFALVDKGEVSAVQTHVEGIVATQSPLAASAQEALGLAQFKAGDLKSARKTFEQIAASPTASRLLLSRVDIYLAQLTAQGVGPEPKPAVNASQAGASATPPAAPSATPSTQTTAPAAQPGTPAAQPGTPAAQPAAPAAQPGTPAAQPAAPSAN